MSLLSANKLTHHNEPSSSHHNSHPSNHHNNQQHQQHHFRRPFSDGHIIKHGLSGHHLLGHHVDIGGDIRNINNFNSDHSGHRRHLFREGRAAAGAFNLGGINFMFRHNRFEGDDAAKMLGVDPHSIMNDSGHDNHPLHPNQDDIFIRHDPEIHDHMIINPYNKDRPDWHHYSPTQPYLGEA